MTIFVLKLDQVKLPRNLRISVEYFEGTATLPGSMFAEEWNIIILSDIIHMFKVLKSSKLLA